jgi:hypothetical protein
VAFKLVILYMRSFVSIFLHLGKTIARLAVDRDLYCLKIQIVMKSSHEEYISSIRFFLSKHGRGIALCLQI